MKRLSIIALAILALSVTGCGGTGTNSGSNPLTGSYRTLFNRGVAISSMLVAHVDTDGTTTMVISDTNGIQFKGIGQANSSTDVTATLTGPGGTIDVTGSFLFQGQPVLRLVLTGATNQTINTQKFANVNTSPFAGTLTVATTGDESGSASITVAADGSISGTASSPSGGSFSVIGAVDSLGSINFHGIGSVASVPTEFTYTGDLFQKPTVNIDVEGEGDWDGGALSGTWSAD